MNTKSVEQLNHRREPWLDHLRGATLVSMIAYHGCWDLVYLLGMDWNWYRGTVAWIWQQSICWTFILLSGYCWPMGHHHWKRGLMTFGAGLLVSAVTIVMMPSSRILCGVLTLLGSAALLMIFLDPVFKRAPWTLGLLISVLLFLMTRNINAGWLGLGLGGPLGGLELLHLPESLYEHGLIGAWLGFMPKGFFSTDYFSILPWFFLFCAGYYLRRRVEERRATGREAGLPVKGGSENGGMVDRALQWMGRHSLLVYLIHQPALYGMTVILDFLI